jgi:hypothetical protein
LSPSGGENYFATSEEYRSVIDNLATPMRREYGVAVRHACRAVQPPRSCYFAPAPERDDHDVIAMIEEYIRDNPRHGCDKMYVDLRYSGYG